MKYLIDLIILVQPLKPLDLLIQFVLLLALSLFFIWMASVLISGALRKRFKGEPIDVIMYLAILRGALVYFIAFSIYWLFVVKASGLHAFHWDRPVFYLTMTPRILLFLLAIVFFLYRYSLLTRLIRR